jgi:DNA-binding XRE family transcriptional regulator
MRENLSLGKKIRVMRIIRGIEQDEFAQLVDATYQTVSGWENDHHVPHDRNMERIKAVLRWPDEDQAQIAFAILADTRDGDESG